jgi:hypothetical protein
MSTNPQRNTEDQEIDLSMVSQKFRGFFQGMNDFAFDAIQFALKNKIILGALLVLGVGIGIYLDKTNKSYEQQVVVMPNFGSNDYVYAKVDLINAKVKENDTLFLERIGIKEPSKFSGIEIKPIVDVYEFVTNSSERNFDLLKLMAEDSDIKKIIEERTTSKNYPLHTITFKTNKRTTKEKTVEPLLKYLNNSAYFTKIQHEAVNNIEVKMKANDAILAQIDGFLNGIASGKGGSEKLVYYNENSPLNDIIESKERIVRDQGNNRISLINSDKIIKDVSQVLNIENKEAVNGKLKLILPLLFIFIFVCIRLFADYYKKQAARRAQIES